MKKILVFLGVIIITVVTVFSQVLFEFKIDVEKKITNNEVFADVKIIVSKGPETFQYQITPATGINAEPIYKSRFTKKREFVFKNIPEGKYYIKLVDENGKSSGQQLIINSGLRKN